MDLFDVLSLIGGLSLFLFGMNLMGESLEKRAGHSLTALLSKLTSGKMAGFLTGLGVTAVIQSSSATTVMVVGFVNSGIMSLKQAINVIMGANVGTTITAWLLSLTGIDSSNIIIRLFKPTSFTPILALIGIVLYMSAKNSKRKDTATVLLGFATLMIGMETMSGAVSGLKEVEEFRNILIMFSNPILGVLAGAVLTAIIQSSSASVGILQALSSTGQINFGTAVPIIMGQNIGTCVTALLSSVGTNRNARRASIVHLCFNVIGTIILLSVFTFVVTIFDLTIFTSNTASEMGIAIIHTIFNILCTVVMLPMSGLLEKISYKIVPEPKAKDDSDKDTELDERLMATPAIALDRCRVITQRMANISTNALTAALTMFEQYNSDTAAEIRSIEDQADHYEDILGTYLVTLNTYSLSSADSTESAKLLHIIGDLERISDHAVNILESAEELRDKDITFSEPAQNELRSMLSAVNEIVTLAMAAYSENDLVAATKVEPLEQIVDQLKTALRTNHIRRMQKGDCSIEAGFIWSDILTNLERVSDHCSNIAGCVVEMSKDKLDIHDYIRTLKKGNQEFGEIYESYAKQYLHDKTTAQ